MSLCAYCSCYTHHCNIALIRHIKSWLHLQTSLSLPEWQTEANYGGLCQFPPGSLEITKAAVTAHLSFQPHCSQHTRRAEHSWPPEWPSSLSRSSWGNPMENTELQASLHDCRQWVLCAPLSIVFNTALHTSIELWCLRFYFCWHRSTHKSIVYRNKFWCWFVMGEWLKVPGR